ncbi:MAG: hypothetical protein WD696_17550 [Bryobacteraceae bacterium]
MTVIDEEVLAKVPNAALRVYAVWLPILDEDTEDAANRMLARLRDSRFQGFWDSRMTASRTFGKVLQFPEKTTAWDMYLAYPPGVEWNAAAPTPRFWMHQLSRLPIHRDLLLSGPAFLKKLEDLLR